MLSLTRSRAHTTVTSVRRGSWSQQLTDGLSKVEIAVLGCGPAALLAAHVIDERGHRPRIYSLPEKSVIPGSQHLHGPVRGLTPLYPEGTINFVRMGTARGYAEKVYGDPERNTGWEHYLQVYPSWNVLKAYDKLWDRWGHQVNAQYLDRDTIREISRGYGLTISTIPAQTSCYDRERHTFESVPYYIKPLPAPPGDEGHEIVIYNGLLTDPWYRWSILAGLCTQEFMKPVNGADHGLKAVSNTCTCWPFIHRIGRWAKWQHGVTLFKSYQEVVKLMECL